MTTYLAPVLLALVLVVLGRVYLSPTGSAWLDRNADAWTPWLWRAAALCAGLGCLLLADALLSALLSALLGAALGR